MIGGAAGGVYFSSEIIACAYGMHVTKTLVAVNNREILLTAKAVLDASDYTCLMIDDSAITHFMATGSWFASGGQLADISQGSGIRIAAQASTADFQFTGCRIYNNYAAGAIIDGAVRVSFNGCSILYNGLGAVDAGSSGISVSGTAAPDLIVVGCDIHDNGTGGAGYGIYTNTALTNRVVTDNIFRGNSQGTFNPVGGATAISVSGSPFTYTAGTTPEAVYVSGGTVSAIAKNSVNLFVATGASVWLEPGEAMTVTYSSIPTMIKDRK